MRSYLLLVLLFFVNCDMSTSSRVDYNKISLWFLTINNNTTINNSSGLRPNYPNGSDGTYLSNCDLDCLDTIGQRYLFNDNYPNPNYCHIKNWSSGNNNNIPEPGEQGVLQIPLIYYGTNPLPVLNAELVSENPSVQIFGSKIRSYPELPNPTGKNPYYSCINFYYETWNTYSDSSTCNTRGSLECIGWYIKIPNNYIGYIEFKLLITSSIGSKVFKYKL